MRQCSKLIVELENQVKADESLREEYERLHLTLIAQMLKLYLKEVVGILVQMR